MANFFKGLGYLGKKLGGGFLRSVEGLVDFTAGGIADLFGADEYAEHLMGHDWVDYEKADREFGETDGFWKVAGDIAGGIGSSLPALLAAVGTTVATGGAAAPLAAKIATTAITTTVAGLGAAGSATSEAYKETGELGGEEWGYGALSGAVEGGIELASQGIGAGVTAAGKSLGKTIAKEGAESATKAVAKTAVKEGTEAVTKEAADEAISATAKSLGKETARTLAFSFGKKVGGDMLSEGFEEGVTEWIDPYLKRATYDPNAKNATMQEVGYAALIGALSGGVTTGAVRGAETAVHTVRDLKSGKASIEKGEAEKIINTARVIAEDEAKNETGGVAVTDVIATLGKLDKSLATTGGKVTEKQARLIGRLNRGSVGVIASNKMHDALENVLRDVDGFVARFNEYGMRGADGKPMTLTREELVDGYDFSTRKGREAALSNNPKLRSIVAMDAAGRLMLDTAAMKQSLLRGKEMATDRWIVNFMENSSDAEFDEVSKKLGINKNSNEAEIRQALENYRNTPEYREVASFVSEAKKIASESAKALPKRVAFVKDGIRRYKADGVDIAVMKSGDTYRVYEYATRDVSNAFANADELNANINALKKAYAAATARVESTERMNAEDVGESEGATTFVLSDNVTLYSAEEIESITRDSKNKIAKSYNDVVDFILKSLNNEINGRLFTGKIKPEAAAKIKAQTSISAFGKSLVLTSDELKHIFKHHGDVKVEGPRGQEAITTKNFGSILEAICSPSNVTTETDGNGVVSLVFSKEIDGKTTAVTIVSEKKKALTLKSARITKKGQHISPPSDVQAPNPTPKSEWSMNAIPKDSIPQNGEKVNTETENSEKNSSNSEKKTERKLEAERIDKLLREQVKDYREISDGSQTLVRQVYRQALAHGLSESEALTFARISAHSGVGVMFSKALCRTKDKDGNTVYGDGWYSASRNKIIINPEGTRSAHTTLIHELDHAIRRAYKGKTTVYMRQVWKYLTDTEKSNLRKNYEGVKTDNKILLYSDEFNAYFAEKCLKNKKLQDILFERKGLLEKVVDFFTGASKAYSDDPKLARAAKWYEKRYRKMFEDLSARNRGRNAVDTVIGKNSDNISFALMNKNSLADNVKAVLNMNEAEAKRNKAEGNFVSIMPKTPSVITDNVKDAENLEIIMRFDAFYLATRKNGVLEGHYHDYGEIMAKLPEIIASPEAIVRMDNGRLNLISSVRGTKGNNSILSIELNTVKDINSKNTKYNMVISVIPANDNYTKNNLKNHGIKVEYKKEDLAQVNHQLYEWLATINDKSSKVIIPNPDEKVNTSDKKSLEIPSDASLAMPYTERATVDNYTEEQYNNYGWARVNVLNKREYADFNAKFADASASKNTKPPKTKAGELMIAVGVDGVNRKIVYCSGTINAPKISRILEIDADNETILSDKRSEIYEAEGHGIPAKAGRIFKIHNPTDYGYKQYLSKRSGNQNVRYNNGLGVDRGTSGRKAGKLKAAVFGENGEVISEERRFALPLNDVAEGSIERLERKSFKEKARETVGDMKSGFVPGVLATEIQFTNAQAGIEHAGRKLGVNDVDALVQRCRASRAMAQEMLGGGQWLVLPGAKSSDALKLGEGLEPILSEIRDRRKGESREQAEKRYTAYQYYLYHKHNVDRMSLEKRSLERNEANVKKLAELEEKKSALEKKLKSNEKARAELKGKYDAETKAKRKRIIEQINSAKAALKALEQNIKELRREIESFEPEADKPVLRRTDENGNYVAVTASESEAVIAEYEEQYPEFAKNAERIYKFLDNLLEMQVRYGLIDRKTYDYLREKYPHYVPTFRARTKMGTAPIRGKGNIEVAKTVKTATGSLEALEDLELSISRMVEKVIRAGNVNVLANKLYDAALASGDTSYIKEVSRQKSSENLAESDGELERPKKNQVNIYRNGERITLAVTSEVFSGFDDFNTKEDAAILPIRAVSKVTSIFKSLVTSANPIFLVRNFIRDLQDAGINTRYGKAFVKSYAKAIHHLSHNTELAQLYRAAGGFNSSIFDYADGFVGKQSKMGFSNPRARAKWLFAKVENANMFIEQLPRFAEFISSVEAGVSVDRAILNAADVTTNFGRSGKLTRKLNSTIIPFLNPAVQGLSKVYRNIKDAFSSKRAFASLAIKCAILGIIPMALNNMLYGDDEEYEDVRDTDKENNYLFRVGDTWIKIPKGRFVSVLAGAANRTTAEITGGDADWKEYFENVVSQITPVENFTRPIWSPFTDVSNNKTWYGGEIEGKQFENVRPGQRYDENTSEIAKWIGGKINYSPKKIHYLLDQYSGVIGDFVLPATTQKAEKNFAVSAFVFDPVTNNKLSDDFYKLYDEVQYRKTDGDVTAVYQLKHLNDVKASVSDLYDEITKIQNSDLSTAEKLQQTRVIRILINNAYKTATADFAAYSAVIEETAGMYDESTSAGVKMRYTEITRRMYGAEKAFEEYSSSVYDKIRMLNAAGVDYDRLYAYYFGTKDLDNDYDKDGQVVSGSKRKKVVKVINALDVSKEQKVLLLAAKGYSVDDKKGLLKYILSLDISKDEKLMLAKMCGFKVEDGKIKRESLTA